MQAEVVGYETHQGELTYSCTKEDSEWFTLQYGKGRADVITIPKDRSESERCCFIQESVAVRVLLGYKCRAYTK